MAPKKEIAVANLAVKNQALLERLKAGIVENYFSVHAEIEDLIGETLGKLKVETLDELSAKELERLLKGLRIAQTQLYQDETEALIDELQDLGGYTAGKEAKDLDKLRTDNDLEELDWEMPDRDATWKAVTKAPIAATGDLMKPFLNKIPAANMNRVEGLLRNGWAQGKSIGQLTREVYGTKKNGYKDGLTEMNRRGTEAMVRTAVQHTAMTSRMNFFGENDDLILGYALVATLDLRTTSKCRSLDGKRFELGKGPVPPLHVACRTSVRPDLGAEFDFLDKGATRSSAGGYVDANTTYYDWLKGQTDEDIEEVLGKKRAAIFKSEGMTADKFAAYNMGRNFEPLTLEQLYTKDPTPFRKAGILPRGVTAADDELLGDPPVPEPTPKEDMRLRLLQKLSGVSGEGGAKVQAEQDLLDDLGRVESSDLRSAENPIRTKGLSASEHIVELRDGEVLKSTEFNSWGFKPIINDAGNVNIRWASPSEYLHRIGETNKIFDTQITVEGISERSGRIITSQPRFKGLTPTVSELEEHMKNLGFRKLSPKEEIDLADELKGSTFYNAKTQQLVIDVRPENTIKVNGKVQVFDALINRVELKAEEIPQ